MSTRPLAIAAPPRETIALALKIFLDRGVASF
jgi:hypothetical protein